MTLACKNALIERDQVDAQVLGPGAFQEIDLAAAFAPVARFSQTMLHSSKHAELMTLACKNALIERDVAHLIFPDDVQTLPAGQTGASGPGGRVAVSTIAPPEEVLNEAVALIETSKRPIVIAGYGGRDAMDDIIALAERLNAPVLTTFKAKGQISDDHPLAAGVLGRSGTPVASWVMNECDLILAFGSSFSNHTGITPKRPIIQVDFDRMMLGKFHGVTIPMWSEIGVAARRMTAEISSAMATVDQRAELAKRWSIWREEKRSRLEDDRGHGLNSATVFAALSGAIPGDAVIAVDVGNNTYSFGRYFESRGQRILMSGYLGSIGFSFSAAMGAWAATEDQEAYRGRKVVSVSGDRARRSGARQAVPVGRTRRQLHVQLLLSPGSRFDAVGSGLGSGWGLHRGRHEWLDLDRRPGHGSGRRVDVLGQISLVSGLVPGRPLDHLHRR